MGGCFQFLVHGPYISHACPILDGLSECIHYSTSCAVKEAIESLRSNDVNAFVLDLRDNSGGLFPEGVEIAKIW
ncbi:Carboxyl-terminal-processing peptidase 2, chloroplastic [Vitis vinifera]|uniref:Carboxyl-terminal-processing peptidase 2, chloroplastic n=1 Tax=Vitis vinifera TaxID=29760 RepID=A0A438IJK3_VITVI|nr:Carboxyl-terminal-processing peptidase 2, chloroplastic [Vitis vinifera]